MKIIEQLEAALAAATPGEWGIHPSRPAEIRQKDETGRPCRQLVADTSVFNVLVPWRENARLIALMKNHLPALIECAKALEDTLEWVTTGKVDGVGFDQEQVCDVVRTTLSKLEHTQ